MRTLLILDGTNRIDEALADAQELCDPGDKLTVLAVAEKPPAQLLGTQPGPASTEPYTGGTVGGVASGSPDVPVIESEDATERRVAGELRDELDERTASSFPAHRLTACASCSPVVRASECSTESLRP